jgi:hypothetical protein
MWEPKELLQCSIKENVVAIPFYVNMELIIVRRNIARNGNRQ